MMNFIIRLFQLSGRTSPGWVYPMGWFAYISLMMFVLFGLNNWQQNIVLLWSGWGLTWLFACFGTAAIGYQALRNLRDLAAWVWFARASTLNSLGLRWP